MDIRTLMNIEAWLPSLIATGALGMLFFSMRNHKKELTKKVEDLMPKPEHELLCENASLKITAHVSKEISTLKDDIFAKLRNIEAAVGSGDGGNKQNNPV